MESNKILCEDKCLAWLDETGVKYTLIKHDAVFNMQELKEKVKLEKGTFIKNLLYADKKGNFYLVIAKDETKVGKKFWKSINVTYNNLRFAKDEQLMEVLGVTKGAVNLLAIHNDSENKVKTVIIDKNLDNHEYFAFHPIVNTATVEISKHDSYKIITESNHTFEILELDDDLVVLEDPKAKQLEKADEKKDDGQTKLGLDYKKKENFSKWYSQVIVKSELIEYYDVSGCYILRPWAYSMWEKVQRYLDDCFQSLGVENSYFPLFVSEKALNTEKDHVEGFSPEVAWVTRSGKSDLKEPIAIRPTSETIMYPAFSKWITSHRDLPLKLNQWTNIVRWEFKHPTPFIRTREFLWQEGHTAHSTSEEASEMVYNILDFYKKAYEEMLAVPVIAGIKTDSEKFAGGHFTTTVETIIPSNGRGIQAATSHHLGQNFSKMFGIEFLNDKGTNEHVWQTSWGFTTRSLGVMIMVHSDDKGLVLPPKVARYQAVIVPIPFKEDESNVLMAKASELKNILLKGGIRAEADLREIYTPGWKYNHWELKGVPVRLELGPKDLEKQEVRVVVRSTGKKFQMKWENLATDLQKTLDDIQKEMLANAKANLDSKISKANDWKSFMEELNKAHGVLTKWCEVRSCEEKVKERSGKESKEEEGENEFQLTGAAKTLCKPLIQDKIEAGDKCFHCGEEAKVWVLWGRSY